MPEPVTEEGWFDWALRKSRQYADRALGTSAAVLASILVRKGINRFDRRKLIAFAAANGIRT